MTQSNSYEQRRDEKLSEFLTPKGIKLDQLKEKIKKGLGAALFFLDQCDYPNQPEKYFNVVDHNGNLYGYYTVVSHPRGDEWITDSFLFKGDEVINYKGSYVSLFKVQEDGSVKMINGSRIYKDITPIETSTFTGVSIENYRQFIYHTFEVNEKIYIIVSFNENKGKGSAIKNNHFGLYEWNDDLPVKSEFQINSFSNFWNLEAAYGFGKKLFLFQNDGKLMLTDFSSIWNIDIDCSMYDICSAGKYSENEYHNNERLNTPDKVYLFANDKEGNICKQIIFELQDGELSYKVVDFQGKLY